ncbi:TPA: hypothetical protein QCQ09_004124 [Bacillus cereus]|nr:hypothetical protein [Bacillus cereus]
MELIVIFSREAIHGRSLHLLYQKMYSVGLNGDEVCDGTEGHMEPSSIAPVWHEVRKE